MTRWQTYVIVRGQRKDVDEFENTYFAVHDDTVNFDLNRVVPMPAEIAGGTEAAQIAWRMENWGVGETRMRKTKATCHLIS